MTIVVQTIMPLLHHSEAGVHGPIDTSYNWPGTAASANLVEVAAHRLASANLVEALWQVAWNPNSQNGASVGIRLLDFYSGVGSDVVEWFELTASSNGPSTTGQYCLTEFKAMLDRGHAASTPRQLGHKTKGNGSTGPILYSSKISLVWQF